MIENLLGTSSTTSTSSTSTTTSTALLPCESECCILPGYEYKPCPGQRDCIDFTCGNITCPFECCPQDMGDQNLTGYMPQGCGIHSKCVNYSCVKEPCPFECCVRSTYTKKGCNRSIDACVGHKCVLADTDSDDIPDFLEKRIGTNINKKDSDGDNLTDFDEHYNLPTSPILADTDSDTLKDNVDPNPLSPDSAEVTLYLDLYDLFVNHSLVFALTDYYNSAVNGTNFYVVNETYNWTSTARTYSFFAEYPLNSTTFLETKFNIRAENKGLLPAKNLKAKLNLTYRCTLGNSTGDHLILAETIDLIDLAAESRYYSYNNLVSVDLAEFPENKIRHYISCHFQNRIHNLTLDKATYS
ncbi:MAG: hypothetical protein GF334_01410 [Candidatus Altiarchaeales archaeon]|nr:hypothetical protein [Candidatus Altiarchaeales archaeon]